LLQVRCGQAGPLHELSARKATHAAQTRKGRAP
jgi:hypothetical protein